MTRRGLLVALPIALLIGLAPPVSAADRFPSQPSLDPLFVARMRQPAPPPSLVLIAGSIGTAPAYGCGVIVAAKDRSITVLTAAHNLRIERARFITTDGERLRVTATTVVAGHDLALVTADRPVRYYEVARLAPDVPLGTHVRVWGPVEDRPFTLQEGTIRPLDPRVTDVPAGAFAIDCPACDHGDSGTGVFDDRGHILGIITASYFADKQRLFVLGERYTGEDAVATLEAAP